jgi:ABC-type lipoprotein release transport system permease subunit
MSIASYLSILGIILSGRSSIKILLATLLSFTFSISVILCTVGLMDGFDYLLKSGLRFSSGDLLISSRKGFFEFTDDVKSRLEISPQTILSPVVLAEAFAVSEQQTKGVLVRGIESQNFSSATGLNVQVKTGEVVLGKELATALKVKVGESIALAFGRGNEAFQELPSMQNFRVSGIVAHGIYQKDLRFAYMERSELSAILQVGTKINHLIVAIQNAQLPLESLDLIKTKQQELRLRLTEEFQVKPFWSEYQFLIEAVKVEKVSISMILQLIVLVAVFNILAFVLYVMEKKSQDFFFLRAIGLSLKQVMGFWLISIGWLWAFACLGAYGLTHVFNWALAHLSFLQIPGEIYVLSTLQVRLSAWAIFSVCLASLGWVLFTGFIGYWRLKRQPIMQGLRQEFMT